MNQRSIAYFSMEIALEAAMPTYAGGLGVLAGDTIRSAADLGVPLLAVTLLHRKGYLSQRLNASGIVCRIGAYPKPGEAGRQTTRNQIGKSPTKSRFKLKTVTGANQRYCVSKDS